MSRKRLLLLFARLAALGIPAPFAVAKVAASEGVDQPVELTDEAPQVEPPTEIAEAATDPAAEDAPWDEDAIPLPPVLSIPELIHRASVQYGLDEARFLRIARCESGMRADAYNRASGASGVMQFVPQTWAWASGQAGYAGRSPFEAEPNIMTAGWLARQVGWNQWQCR